MREAALYLYGPYPGFSFHPRRDDMFDRRDKLATMLNQGDTRIRLDVGYVVSDPTGKDENPTVLIAQNPVFDNQGNMDMSGVKFRKDDIGKYPVIVDHWIPNFRYKTTKDGIMEEHASGIGLPRERLINHRNVQEYGNNKGAAEKDILEPNEIVLSSYALSDLDAMEDQWGNGRVIFKPRSGALGEGIQVFSSVDELRLAVNENDVAKNGLVQPFLNLKPPIPNLRPLTDYYDAQLRELNSEPDRVREIRMHFFVTTENGERTVAAYPMLRTSERNAEVMTNWEYTPLDPDAFRESHGIIQDKTEAVAHTLAQASEVPHLYGVADVSLGQHPRSDEVIVFVGDLNCRGPRLPDVSHPDYEIVTPAQEEFINMQKTMAKQNLAS